MTTKFAFVGFQHGHIESVYAAIKDQDDIEITGICDEDEAARERLKERYTFTHTDYIEMLDSIDCDVVAVGDWYAKRGRIIIDALERGKHIISDKPLCTDLAELDTIEKLAKDKGLSVGMQLDLRDQADALTMRRLIREGAIGQVHTFSFGGQHPLMYGQRPGWYFEEGKHGGTLNDIAIHGIDIASWLTDSPVAEVLAARAWNARLPEAPSFQDAAQCLLRLESGCGVFGDVSYLSPDSFKYSLPLYWRMTCHGTDGVIETVRTHLHLYKNGETEGQKVEPDSGTPNGYLESFMKEIQGETEGLSLTTEEVLRSSRATLLTQDAADNRRFGVPVPRTA